MTAEREEVVRVRRVAVISEDRSCVLLCRLGRRLFHVPRYQLANGTFALRPGRETDLMLPRWFAESLGLVAIRTRTDSACVPGMPARRCRAMPTLRRSP